jgi:hypothetical protein
MVCHADGRNDAVEREYEVEDQNLANHAHERDARGATDRRFLVLMIRRDMVADLAGRLVDQEQAATDQDEIPPRKYMPDCEKSGAVS